RRHKRLLSHSVAGEPTRCPQRDSNPRYGLERAATWTASRWGRGAREDSGGRRQGSGRIRAGRRRSDGGARSGALKRDRERAAAPGERRRDRARRRRGGRQPAVPAPTAGAEVGGEGIVAP